MLRSILMTSIFAVAATSAQAGGGGYERVYETHTGFTPSYAAYGSPRDSGPSVLNRAVPSATVVPTAVPSRSFNARTAYFTPSVAAPYIAPSTIYVPEAQTTSFGFAPATVNIGSIEQVQPELNHTVGYQLIAPTAPAPIPAVTTTIPTQIFRAPLLQQPAATAPFYSTATTYTLGTNIVTEPASVIPTVRAAHLRDVERLHNRVERQRTLIKNAAQRGDLQRWERRILRRELRGIRSDFRAFELSDGQIDALEANSLRAQLDLQSDRIHDLANNAVRLGSARRFGPL